jgi:hypothetical protein
VVKREGGDSIKLLKSDLMLEDWNKFKIHWLKKKGERFDRSVIDQIPADTMEVKIANTKEGWKIIDTKSGANTMHRLHGEFLAELKEKAKADNVEVCLFSLSFMELMEDHELFQRGVRRGDFVATEALLLSWLPNWQAAGKKHK